jgi:KaiC/GvpD/RAD55 family RecA-like ATPase
VLNDDEVKAWRQKTLTSIIGLSGVGKSIFLVNFARDNLENGYNVLYISTEMDEVDILERLAKSLYRVLDEREVILKEAIPIGKLSIQKVHPYDTTYLDIQGIIDTLGWKPDIVYIDYADELKSHEEAKSEYDAQGIIYSGLKKLAEMNDIPVVTATQTNRTAEAEGGGTKKYIGYAAVADSSKKIRLADTLFSIIQSPCDKDMGIISLTVIKNRKNTSGQKMPFDINYSKMRIEERDKPLPPVTVSHDDDEESIND